jgi:hypothetical protein
MTLYQTITRLKRLSREHRIAHLRAIIKTLPPRSIRRGELESYLIIEITAHARQGLDGNPRRTLAPFHREQHTMTDAIRTYLPWLLSAITIWMTLMAGNKHPKAWLIGLGNQLLWLIWICVVGAWGLLPMNITLWIVYGRNHLKWSRDLPANNVR